jgi:hypothetical protein
MSIAEAARREKISEQSIGRWKADFREAGKPPWRRGNRARRRGEEQLEAEVADLTQVWVRRRSCCRCGRNPRRAGWPFRRPRGDPHRGGHADHEVLSGDRHARANLASQVAKARAGCVAKGPVAGAGTGRGDRSGYANMRWRSQRGRQDLGGGPPRRPRGVGGDGAAAAAGRGFDPAHGLPAGASSARSAPQGRVRQGPARPEPGVAAGLQRVQTTTGDTWRLAGCRDYWTKYEHPFHVSPTANQHDAIDAIELAPGRLRDDVRPPDGRRLPPRPRDR